MNLMASIWRLINLLSLDVVFGAMAGMLFFVDLLDVQVPGTLYIVLGMAVWCIYTLDHLLDGRKITHWASSERHRFHQKYAKPLSVLLVLMILSGLGIVIYVERLHFMLIPGAILGTMVVLWMGMLYALGKKASWLKEVSTAIFYVAGISLAPFFSMFPNTFPKAFFLLAIGYFLLAAINLYILSYLDAQHDDKDDLGSALALVSKKGLKKFILLVSSGTVIYLLFLLIIFPSYYRLHSSILLILVIFHVLEFYRSGNHRLREKLEASFLLPLILLIF